MPLKLFFPRAMMTSFGSNHSCLDNDVHFQEPLIRLGLPVTIEWADTSYWPPALTSTAQTLAHQLSYVVTTTWSQQHNWLNK